MWDGGVATWKRSSAPSPRAATQCPVAAAIVACVWRTAFGSPVVPELNTRTTSSSGCGGGPSSVRRRGVRQRLVDVDHGLRAEALDQDGSGGGLGDRPAGAGDVEGVARPRSPSRPG